MTAHAADHIAQARMCLISREHLERLAFRNQGALIEFTSDAAFLTLNGETFYALLTPLIERASIERAGGAW